MDEKYIVRMCRFLASYTEICVYFYPISPNIIEIIMQTYINYLDELNEDRTLDIIMNIKYTSSKPNDALNNILEYVFYFIIY